MRKILYSIILVIMVSGVGFSLRVSEKELSKGKKKVFVKYRGRYRKIISRADKRIIGIELARRSIRVNRRFRLQNKYSIIRAYDKYQKTKFDADIFSIDLGARIVDIKAIQVVIGAYLETKYGYSEVDGLLLAKFVTYYNATYRLKYNYFKRMYKRVVMRYLRPYNVGISIHYTNWVGRTKIVIPLTRKGKKGTLSLLDSSELTSKKVIKKLQKKGDKGLEDRKKIVEFKKREVKDRQDKIDKQKRDLKKKQDAQQKKKADYKKDKKKLRDDKKAIAEKKKIVKTIKDPVKKKKLQTELKKDEKNVKDDSKKLKKKATDIKKDDNSIKKDETKIKQDEKTNKKKTDEIKKDVASIKKDEKKTDDGGTATAKKLDEKAKKLDAKADELKKREEILRKKQSDPLVFSGVLYYLKKELHSQTGHYHNKMFLINPFTRKIILQSPFGKICGTKYDIFSKGVIVVGFEGEHDSGHFLVLLDSKKLAVVVRGNENIYWKSFVKIKEGLVYAIYKTDAGYFLGQFDASLKKLHGSSVTIDKDTFISFYGDYIYVNGAKQQGIFVLARKDLKKIDKIAP